MFSRGFILFFQILFVLAGLRSAFANTEVSQQRLYLNDTMDKHSIGLILEYLEDKEGRLKIDDILSDEKGARELQWEESDRKTLEFGFTSSSYWVRFTVVNPHEKAINWQLEVDYPHINLIQLYKFTDKNHFEIKEAGNSFPFSKRDLVYRSFIFNQAQRPETQSIYYMRFQTTGSMDISLWAWSPAFLEHTIHYETILFGMYYGVLLLVSLFTLLSFFLGRKKAYLFFSTWIISYGLYQLSVNGLAFQYFWPESAAWERISVPFFVLLAAICGLQYWRSFLALRHILPLEDKIVKGLMSLAAVSMAFVFIFPLPIALMIAFVIISYIFRLMYIARFTDTNNPFLATNFFVAAWIILLVGNIAFAFKSIGILPSNFMTNWSQQIGSLLHIILVGIALSNTVKMANREKENAQIKAIEALKTAAIQKDEFLAQTTQKNIEIEKLNAELKKHIQDLNVAKEEISISEEKYRILVEGSNDMIFTLDQNFKFLNVSNGIFFHLKMKPEEVRSKHFLDIVSEGSDRVSVLKQLVQEKLDSFAADRNPISFKTDFQVAFSSEPKEMRVYLEYINIEGRNEIIGKATRIEEDLLMKYIESEQQHLVIGNFFITAEDISHRVTRNLGKYMDNKKVYILRIALREIIINAIEHGNLEISFEEKGRLIDEDKYFVFLAERQQDPIFNNRHVRIEYSIDPHRVTYQITDEGNGFDYEKILAGEVLGVGGKLLGHGRGIAMAKSSFDEMNFNDKGNQVVLIKYFN